MIKVDGLTKNYGALTAVDNISFNVEKGEILGFLGPNGAGKSTTMKMISCFITPSSGTANVGGKDIRTESVEVRKLIGYLPESAPSYKSMTVLEFLRFMAEIRGYSKNEIHVRTDRVIELTSLEKVCYQTIDTLSKGYKQRVGFAQALIHDPPVLILDEPTDGLDPNQKHEVRTLIRQMAKDKVIILSTHILEEMEAVCSRAVIISMGTIVADGTPAELISQSNTHNAVSLFLADSANDELISGLGAINGVKAVETGEDTSRIKLLPESGQSIINNVNEFISQKDIKVSELFVEKGQMDEVFRKLTIG